MPTEAGCRGGSVSQGTPKDLVHWRQGARRKILPQTVVDPLVGDDFPTKRVDMPKEEKVRGCDAEDRA